MYKYVLVYWLPNQSRLFSEPQTYFTNDKDSFVEAIKIAVKNGYDIAYQTEVKND